MPSDTSGFAMTSSTNPAVLTGAWPVQLPLHHCFRECQPIVLFQADLRGRGQVTSGSSADKRINRTTRRHPIMSDNAGLSGVLLVDGSMADRIGQNPENIANEHVAGSLSVVMIGGWPGNAGFLQLILPGRLNSRPFAGRRRPGSEQHSEP